MHLHRHTFEVRQLEGHLEMYGLRKDVVLIRAKSIAEVEFVADNPGKTLFHCRDYGRLFDFDSLHYQQQQLFVVTDLNVSPVWEINFGVGIGPTAGTDHLIVKGILGRRFNWGRRSAVE
jgi:Multicopper oxidase